MGMGQGLGAITPQAGKITDAEETIKEAAEVAWEVESRIMVRAETPEEAIRLARTKMEREGSWKILPMKPVRL